MCLWRRLIGRFVRSHTVIPCPFLSLWILLLLLTSLFTIIIRPTIRLFINRFKDLLQYPILALCDALTIPNEKEAHRLSKEDRRNLVLFFKYRIELYVKCMWQWQCKCKYCAQKNIEHWIVHAYYMLKILGISCSKMRVFQQLRPRPSTHMGTGKVEMQVQCSWSIWPSIPNHLSRIGTCKHMHHRSTSKEK